MIAWGESLDYISNAWTKFLSVIQFKAGIISVMHSILV